MKDVFLVRSETSEGTYVVLGVFMTDDDAYLFAHTRRSAASLNIMKIKYYPLTGVVAHTRIEYL